MAGMRAHALLRMREGLFHTGAAILHMVYETESLHGQNGCAGFLFAWRANYFFFQKRLAYDAASWFIMYLKGAKAEWRNTEQYRTAF